MPINFPQIGAEQFLTLGGPLDFMQGAVEVESWPGVFGLGVWLLGDRSTPFQVRTVRDSESVATARERVRQYNLLAGTVQTLELYTGDAYDNILVERVGGIRFETIKTPCSQSLTNLVDNPGNDPTLLIFADWTLRSLEPTPAP